MLTGPSLFVFTTWGWKTRTSGIHLGVLLRQDGQSSQRAVMSNGLATFIILKVAQLTWVDTKILPDREAFAFIACGESQYSFSLLGGGCFCFHVCVPCARIGIFIHAFQAINTISSLLCRRVHPPTSERMYRFGHDGRDRNAEILQRTHEI